MSESRRKLLTGAGPFTREWLAANIWILGGALLAAGGYNLFIIPHDVVPGGMVGAAQLVNQVTGWPIGLVALCINIPILVLASQIMGPGYGVRPVFSMTYIRRARGAARRWWG